MPKFPILSAIQKRRGLAQKVRKTNIKRAAEIAARLAKKAAKKSPTLTIQQSPEEKCKSDLFVSMTHINYAVRAEAGKGCVFKCVGSSRDEHFSGDKHGAYAQNGYLEICQKHASVYNRSATNLSIVQETQHGTGVLHTPAAPAWVPNPLTPGAPSNTWYLDFADNYRCAYHPFNHDYHHMLPWSALYGTFTTPELEIIQSSEYNINAGVNLIILPMTEEYAAALELPRHPHDHPFYTADVKKLINGVKKALTNATPHPLSSQAACAGIKPYFEAWEKEEFDVIVKWGGLNPGKLIDGDDKVTGVDGCDLNAMMDAANNPVSGKQVVNRATLV
jgi:hypothetical protein